MIDPNPHPSASRVGRGTVWSCVVQVPSRSGAVRHPLRRFCAALGTRFLDVDPAPCLHPRGSWPYPGRSASSGAQTGALSSGLPSRCRMPAGLVLVAGAAERRTAAAAAVPLASHRNLQCGQRTPCATDGWLAHWLALNARQSRLGAGCRSRNDNGNVRAILSRGRGGEGPFPGPALSLERST